MYEQKMIQAMSILVDNAISKLKFDKSIQAEIFQVVNPELAEYKVKYAGNIFTAYSNDLNYKYKVGDAVWVKVPEGDFSNKKFIENKVSARSVPTGVVEDQIFNLTPPVAEFTPEKDSAGVRSRYAERDTWTASAEDLQNRLLLNKDFAVYSKGYKNFQIKASFTTKFKEPLPAKGNYGIKVTFTTEKPEVSPSFVLDRTFFLGDYYNNALDVEQSGEFSVAEDVVLTGIKSIELFAEGFDVTGEDYKDIFLSSFTMTYIDIVDLNNVPYYLKLSTPEGFSGNTIKAKAQLFIQGELQKDDDYEIQWYEQDYSVTSSSDKYNRDGGYGWALIDGATGKEFTLERKRYTNSYKAIAYFDNNKASANIQVVGVSPETLQLVRQENKLTVLTLDSQKPDDSLTYTWYASMPNGSYLQIQEPSNDNSVNIEPYLVYSGIIFYCEVSDSQGVYARLSSAHLSGEMIEEGISVAFIGEEFFNYDANGDIPVEDALRDRELSVSIDWGEYPEPKRFELKWVAPDGAKLEPLNTLPSSANKHDCERSQIQELWVDVNNVLHYCIKQRFSLTNVDNTIGLKVIDLDNDKTFLFSKTFTFLKDGDTGTNGTTYAARIAYCDVNGAVIEGFGGLKWDIVNSWSTAYVRVLIYHNGEELTPAEYQDWNLTWQGKNVIIGDGSKETSKGSEVISITGSGIDVADEHYIRVSAQYRGSGQSNINLYPHFAVDVYVGDLNPRYLDATEIPSSIVYSSSGVNPKFYNKALKVKYWNPNTSDYDEFRGSDGNFTISTGELVITEQKRDNDYYLNPFESINNANGEMPVYSYAFNGFTVYHTTLLYINTYGNEAINGWDGISVEIDNEGGNIFAPQIGAGIKNADNTFTGVVMGKVGDTSAGSGSSVYGLYGYNAGENTFYVTEKGDCYLKGKISSAEGEIGGWKITSNALYSTGDIARPGSANPSPTDKNIRLQSNGTFARNLLKDSQRPSNLKFAIGDKFAVDEDGVLYSGGAVIKASKLSITVDNAGQTEDKTVNDFIQDYYNSNIKEKLDNKIETYYNVTDPSVNWTREEDKESHIGDIWTNPDKVDESGKVIENGFTKIWNGSSWEDTTATPPGLLIDKWDGKKTVFNSQPVPPYYLNDLWIHGDGSGDIKYCVIEKPNVGDTFSQDDWKKADGYADDVEVRSYIDGEIFNLQKQLDGKIQTFYQEKDPSAGQSWGEDHTGDLWYNPNTKKTQRWNGKDWEEYNGALPQDLFDKTDGNRQIVYTNNEDELPPVPYEKGDFWLPGLNSSLRVCITPKNANETASKDDWSIYSYYANESDITNATTALDNKLNYLEVLKRLTHDFEDEGLYDLKGHLGINAKGINAGALSVAGPEGETFYADYDTGEVRIKAQSFSLQNQSINQIAQNEANTAVNSFDGKLTQQEVFNRLIGGSTQDKKGLYLEGGQLYLNASYIKTGAFQVGGNTPDTATFYANYADGEVRIKAKHLEISAGEFSLTGDTTLANKFTNYDTEIEDVRNSVGKSQSLTMVLSNEYEGIPCSADGEPIGSVNVTTSVTVFYGSSDVTSQCTYNTDVKSNIEGSFDSSSHIYTITDLTADSGYAEIKATYQIDAQTNISVTRQFNVVKVKAGANGANGQNGQDGAPARIYSLDPMDLTAFVRDPVTKVVTPDFIYYEASYRDGIDTSTHAVPRTFIIERYDSADGSAFSLTSTHSVGTMESWGGSEGTTLEGKALRFVLKESQGSPNILDVKTVPIIDNGKDGKDGTSLTDKEIFDKVTDYGKKQGLFVDSSTGDGKVYINASYIRSGILEGNTIRVGGYNNEDGLIEVYTKASEDGDATRIGYWDSTGLHITTGSISGTAISGGTISGATITSASQYSEAYGTLEIKDGEFTFNSPSLNGSIFQIYLASWFNTDPWGGFRDCTLNIGERQKDGSALGTLTVNILGKLSSYSSLSSYPMSTSTYGTRALTTVASASPTYSDIGSATCDETGIAYINIDSIFQETISSDYLYKVFFTPTSDKQVYYVKDKTTDYFTVVGEPGATLDWIIYAPRKGTVGERLLEVTDISEQKEAS